MLNPKTPRQLALDLRPVPRWGGRREGAGRKPAPRPRDPHRRRPVLAARFLCHGTLRVRQGLPSLRSARLVRELQRSFAAACERGEFRLVHFSLQCDHAHLLVEARDRTALARAVNRIFQRRGRVVADRCHHRILRSPREVRWPQGFVCPRCPGRASGTLRPRRLEPCRAGRPPTSLTAGTVLHRTRRPLRVWRWAIPFVGRHQTGLSALPL